MERVAEFLQTNAYIIVVMFVFSVGKIVSDIVARRKQLWRDFLSRKIALPVYVYVIVLIVAVLLKVFWPVAENQTKPLRTVQGVTFGVQSIPMDGNRFVRCEFNGTELVFAGEAGFALENCGWKERPRIKVEGPANRTLRMLQLLYKDPVFRPIAEATLEGIKAGKLREVPPPSTVLEK